MHSSPYPSVDESLARLHRACGFGLVRHCLFFGMGGQRLGRTSVEGAGVKMPSFFTYMAYSTVALGPLFVALTLAFLS